MEIQNRRKGPPNIYQKACRNTLSDPPGPPEEPGGTPKDVQAHTRTQNTVPKELKGATQAPQREPMKDPGGPQKRSLPQKAPKKGTNNYQNPMFLKKREISILIIVTHF